MEPVTGADDAPRVRVRPAGFDDVDAIVELVQELARYEREPDAAQATAGDFHLALFGHDPRVHAHIAEVAGANGWEVAGIAVWFVSFSTWTGRHGLWLEDLFVRPRHRRLGLGRMLLATLAGVCAEREWSRFEWWVLDWNEPAHAFYRSLGAVAQDEWTTWRLDGDQLAALAASRPTP